MFDPYRTNLDWLGAWITGRALARGLPLPFRDRGGWRAEIGLETERRRWLFDKLGPEVLALAREIKEPGNNLRVLCRNDDLREFLPKGWVIGAPSFAMVTLGMQADVIVPEGFRLETRVGRFDTHVAILSLGGELAASGHAGIGEDAFVYDRIVTRPEFGRRGLGTAVMHALAGALPHPEMPQLLVATEAGRKLYEHLGWRVLGPYASAGLAI